MAGKGAKIRIDRSPHTRVLRDKKIERKIIQLSKDHPENEYEVAEVTVKDKRNIDRKLINIKRIKGRRPHRTKEQQKERKERNIK